MSGTTHGLKVVLVMASPSTALSTEMEGVITPSPYSNAAPMTPRSAIPVTRP